MISKRQDVGRGVEQMIAGGDADRLQRRSERRGAAEGQRGPQAQHRIPAREDHERHRGDALAARTGPRSSCRDRTATGTSRRCRRGSRRPWWRAGGSAAPNSPWRAPRPRFRRRCGSAGPSAWCGTPSSSIGASTTPIRNSTLMRSAARTCGMSLHQPKSIAGSRGAVGSISGLPRKNASPVPNSISAMPTAMSLTRGSEQMPACSAPSSGAGDAGGEHAEPRRAGEIGDAVGAHRAHHQRAFEAEIDAAGALGDAFAEADEQERRGDADRAAEHGERHGPQSDRTVRHLRISPSGSRCGRTARRSPARTRR